MAKTLSDLTLSLAFETAQLRKGVEETKAGLKGLKQEVGAVGNSFNSLKDYAKGLMPALAIGTFITGAIAVGNFALNISKLTQEIKTLTGASGGELTNITARVSAIASTYGKEFKEISSAANSLSKQMGISFGEALTLIQKGFGAGGSASEEFIDTIREYPAQFKAAGFSAEEFIAITAFAAKEGIFSDKAIDSIKEATLKLREMPQATKDALAGIGLSSSEIQKGLQNGSLTIKEVINQISTKIGQLPASSATVGTAIADIFGSAGEDAGLKFITGIAKIPTSLDAAQTEIGIANNKLIESQTNLNKVWGTLFGEANSGWTNLKATVIDFAANAIKKTITYLVDFINYFIELYNNSMYFRAMVQNIIFYFKEMWEVVKYVVANIINSFKSAGEIIAFIFNPKNWGDGFSDGLANIIVNSMKRSVDAVTTLGKNTADNFKDAFNNVVTKEKVKLIKDPFGEGQETGKNYAKGIQDGVKTTLANGGIDVNKREKAPAKLKAIGQIDDPKGQTNAPKYVYNSDTKQFEGKADKKFSINTDELASKQNKQLDKDKEDKKKADWLEEALAMNKFNETLDQTILLQREYTKNGAKMNAFTAPLISGLSEMSSAMVDAAVQGASSMSQLANAALDAGKAIIRSYIQQAAAAVLKWVMSTIPFPFNMVAGPAAMAGTIALGNAALNAIPMFADGAVVTGATHAIIGEKGTEAILNKMQLANLANDLFNNGRSNTQVVLQPSIHYEGEGFRIMLNKVNKRKQLT